VEILPFDLQVHKNMDLISAARSFLHPFSLKQDIFLLYTDPPNVNEIWKSSS